MSFEEFREECKSLAGKEVKLEKPPKEVGVDVGLALPCFQFEGGPNKKAKELEEKINKKKKTYVKEAKAQGPYLNFYINWDEFSENLELKDIEKKNKNILLEHTSVNPSGPIHVGRLRNSIIGDTLKRILKASGYDVETHYYVNNMGKQMAMILWGNENNIEPSDELKEKYMEYKNKSDFKTMFTYVESNKKSKDGEIQKILKNAEEGNKDILNKLEKISENCLEGQLEVLKRINVDFDEFDFESKYVKNRDTKKILDKLDEYLIERDGLKGLDLSKFGLERRGGILPLLRKDGTSVYILRDIAYHLEKSNKSKWLVNVVGEDHKVEMKELKTILKEYFDVNAKIDVIHFAFVSFEGMQLSTRKGQTAPLDLLLDDGLKKSKEEMEKRDIDYDKKRAEKITTAAIRYSIIKHGNNKQIKFNWEEALNFEGDTGPYLQYTYARASSILRKAEESFGKLNPKTDKEKKIIKKLSKFNYVLEESGEQFKPNTFANYLYDLCSLFNEFYHETKVIGSKREKDLLLFVKIVKENIKKGLNILGIEAIEEM